MAPASDPTDARRRALAVFPDWPWPATSGGHWRISAIVDALTTFADVTVLAVDDAGRAAPPRWQAAVGRFRHRHGRLPTRVWDLTLGLLRGRHVTLQRAIASGLPSAFRDVIASERPSLVILGRGFGGPFIEIAKKSGALVVLEADESLINYNESVLGSKASRAARLRAALDLLAVRRMEPRDFTRADQVWLSNKNELDGVQASLPNANLRLIPSVAPPTAFEPPGPVLAVALIGWFRHPPNEEAALYLAESVMPAVRATGGPGELRLIGRDPTNRMLDVAKHDRQVVVAGAVPDIVAELRRAGVLAMPVRSGGGSRIKALEAAAAGVPIVSTAFGMSGLALVPGRDYLLAESPADFAVAINSLANDAALREGLTSNARAAVAAHHSPESLARIIQAAVEVRGRRG